MQLQVQSTNTKVQVLIQTCENFPYLQKVRQVLQFYLMQTTWNLGRKEEN